VRTNSYRLDNLLASRATSHAGTEQLGTYSYSWDANKNKTAEAIGAQGSGFGSGQSHLKTPLTAANYGFEGFY
jgi:hypothetical protein